MSKLGINTGSSPNDGTGNSLLEAGIIINSNFNEIYSVIGDGSNINIGIGKSILTTTLSGNVGVGSTVPTSKFDVSGNVKVSGVVTSTTFVGQLNSGISTITTLSIPGSVSGNLNVDGNIRISGISTFLGITTSTDTLFANNLVANRFVNIGIASFKDTTQSISTTTGAVIVSGGLGIGKDVNISGAINIEGNSTLDSSLKVVPSSSSFAGIFSGTTSKDMVRITQLGTGNALVVEDSSNPDATPFVVGAAGSVGIGTSIPSSFLHLGEGTVNSAPLKFSPGTNLTTPQAGTLEYNGSNIYATPETVSGRGYIPVFRTYRLTENGSALGTALTNFYGASSAINLESNSVYDIECFAYFLKSTVGVTTWTLTTSSAPTLIFGYFPSTASFSATGQTQSSYSTVYTVAGRSTVGIVSFTGISLANGAYYDYYFKIHLITNASTTFNLQVSQAAGTITPLAGSYYTVKKISDTTGSFA